MAEPIPEKEIEGAYELPEGWVWANIGSLFELKYGKGLVKEKRNADGQYAVFGSGGVVGTHDSAISSGRTIIIGRKGSVGEISLSNKECWPIDTTYYIDRFPLNIPIKYWSLQLKYLVLGQHDTSTAIPGLNRNDVYSIEVPLPPLAEQRRIVAKLEALLAQVNAAKDHLAAVPPIIKRFRQSVLAAACSGRLTEDWRREHLDVEPASELLKRIREERIRRYEVECQQAKADGRRKPKNIEPQGVQTEGLPELPHGWAWCTWNDLVDWITYGFTRPMSHVEHGIPIITAKNITNSMINFSFSNHTTEEAFRKLSEKDKPRQGEILITKDGSIGRAAIVDSEKCFCINQSVALLRFGGLTANISYLLKAIESQFTQDLIEKGAKGTAIRHISITAFGKFPIPLPPLSEQHAIVNRIETPFHRTSKVEERVAAATAHAGRLTQSILAKAFRGELVLQDPDDEPAPILLERIRRERKELKKKKKPQKRRSKTLSDSN